MRLVAAASLRHLAHHPWQLALALLGLALGVGTIVAVDVATGSARRAFELSLAQVNGAATHQISAGPRGIDEALYVRLRREPPGDGGAQFAPVTEGYVQLNGRTLELLGIDPFAAGELHGATGAAAAASSAGLAASRGWFDASGAVLLGAATARELRLTVGAPLRLEVGGIAHAAHLAGTLGEVPGSETLIVTDIAQAQEWLGSTGRLTRIDVRLPDRAAEAALRARLPPQYTLTATRARSQETLAMSDAFTTNLRAMSLLALLVGTFLIYGAVSFAVLQRRRVIGVLRALGVRRGTVLALLLGEAALLGLAGCALGLLLGLLIARELVALVSRTINDLYFVVAVNSWALPPATLWRALLAGVGTALIAALVPALEVAASAPRLALLRTVLEERAARAARLLAWLALACALSGALCIALSGKSLLGGFVALFLLLVAVAALTPAALVVLARLGARVLAPLSPVARLALEDLERSLSRTGVALAALGMALTAMLGVAVMVASFRASLEEWLAQTLRADVYVSAPGPADAPARRLDPQLVRSILAVPGVAAHSEGRRVTVASADGELELNALRFGPGGTAGFNLTAGERASAWEAFGRGAVLISEPLAFRLGLRTGARLTLTTAEGPEPFAVAGVYREYGNERGEVLMGLDTYRRKFGDESIGALGLYLAPGADAAQVMARLRQVSAHRQSLYIRSNAELRSMSMRIFDRTFVITRVLNYLAAGVAALALVSALLAWELARARELALLRALGVTPALAAALILAQTLFMGLAAFLVAVPAGVLTALVLTDVINRRAFGWQIDLHLAVHQFGQALLLALAAAAAAALYPAWRTAVAQPAVTLREE